MTPGPDASEDDALFEADLRIRNAREKIKSLEVMGLGNRLGDGYHFEAHPRDAQGGPHALVLRVHKPPKKASVIFGEALYSLRSALDVATVAIAKEAGASSIKHVYFPFAQNEEDLRNSDPNKKGTPQAKIKDLPEATKQAIYESKPYPGGCDWLVWLNQLRNADTHVQLTNLANLPLNFARIIVSNDLRSAMAAEIAGAIISYAFKNKSLQDGAIIDVSYNTNDVVAAAEWVNEFFKMEVVTKVDAGDNFPSYPALTYLNEFEKAVGDAVERIRKSRRS